MCVCWSVTEFAYPSSDDDEAVQGVTTTEGDVFTASRPSLSEQNDTVAPLPDDEEARFVRHKHTFAQAISDADSAIGMVGTETMLLWRLFKCTLSLSLSFSLS